MFGVERADGDEQTLLPQRCGAESIGYLIFVLPADESANLLVSAATNKATIWNFRSSQPITQRKFLPPPALKVDHKELQELDRAA
jgi:hypothetical protein